jgi:hypothetical protein
MFAIVFSTWMTVILLIDFITIYQPKFTVFRKTIPIFTLFIFISLYIILPKAKENYQTVKQQNYPSFLTEKEEIKQWSKQLEPAVFNSIQNTSLCIDDPQSGRLYTLFNTQETPPFPCPYFVYFYSPNSHPDTAVSNRLQHTFYTNAIRQMSFLLENTPTFIIIGNNGGFLSINKETKKWFSENYRRINRINYQSFNYSLYQRK